MVKTKNESKKLVLLIEDEEIMVSLLVRALEKAGYDVRVARDGESGLKLIHELKPDLVLLDIILPKKGGFEILEELNKEKILPGLAVIIVSNSGQPVEVERATNLGVRDYLIKVNFDPHELLNKVDQLFRVKDGDTTGRHSDREVKGGISATILLIEDDAFLVDLLERAFVQRGCKVFKAQDAAQARRELGSHGVDLILLDIVLPGMDGFTFLKELKSDLKWKDIPVLIVSNLGQREEVERGLKGGAEDYIIKAHATTEEIFKRAEEIIFKRSRSKG